MGMSKQETYYAELAEAANSRRCGRINAHVHGYETEGGSYIIASNPSWNDDGLAHDLVAILPVPLNGSRVHPLRITASPVFVDKLRALLDGED